ncbi:hypothetical protein B0H13DRAFT_2344055 [Mycena leptocephala]|nr:hypothetical protein B0H13DRAFT_2344055 [Mycena leptocephala]
MQGRSRNGAEASFVSRTTSNFPPASRRPISRLPCGFRPRCVAYPPPVAPFRVHLLHHVPLSTSGQKAALISSNLGCLFTVCKPRPFPPAPELPSYNSSALRTHIQVSDAVAMDFQLVSGSRSLTFGTRS